MTFGQAKQPALGLVPRKVQRQVWRIRACTSYQEPSNILRLLCNGFSHTKSGLGATRPGPWRCM
jgi:hypothetical protein